MSDRNPMDTEDDVAAQDDHAAALEVAEIERDDNLVNDEATNGEVTIPPSAEIDQPGLLPPDGV